jgi:hypothetical protein
MKQDEAKALIAPEWVRWIQSHCIDPGGPTGRDTLQFFFELQDARSPLLDFQTKGRDKWRIIDAWVRRKRKQRA